MLHSERQMSAYKGAAPMIDAQSGVNALPTDRDHEADWFRAALAKRGIAAGILSKVNPAAPLPHGSALCCQRPGIENMFGEPKYARRTCPESSACLPGASTVDAR